MANTKPVGVAYSDPELVSGTTITGAVISGGSIDGAAVGGTTAGAGTFTTATAATVVSTGDLYIKSATVAAAGSTQANATALAGGFSLVSGADATKGVLLPPAVAGRVVIIKNGAAAVLKVWPSAGDGINAVTVDSNFTMASLTSCMYVAYDATTWYTVPLVAS